MTGEDLAKQLLADLEEANAAPNLATRDVRALCAVSKFLKASGVEQRLAQPFIDIAIGMLHAGMQRHSGGRLRDPNETVRYARAAAMVTFLNDDGMGRDVKDALKHVSKIVGLDKKRLESFRDNILRSRGAAKRRPASEASVLLYDDSLKKFRADPEMIRVLLARR
jgi:hypothetical protein